MHDGRELSGIDRAIVDALDVHLSPDFHARVRRRIANVPMRRPFWQGWRVIVPAAAVSGLAAAILLAVTLRPGGDPPQMSSPLAARPLPLAHLRPALRAPAPEPVAAAQRPSAGRVRRVAAPTVAPEPEVLVPAEEIAMYRRLFAAVKQVPRAFVVEGPHDIVAPGSVSEIAIDPIRIDLIAPPPGGEGDRQ